METWKKHELARLQTLERCLQEFDREEYEIAVTFLTFEQAAKMAAKSAYIETIDQYGCRCCDCQDAPKTGE